MPYDVARIGSLAARIAPHEAVDDWLRRSSETTRTAYASDLGLLAKFLGATDGQDAARILATSGRARATSVVRAWRESMREAGLSPATVNRRMSAIRSLCSLMHDLDLTTWELARIAPLKSQAYRDTRGPGPEGVRAMLELAGEGIQGRRNRAILRLLHDRALRRGEVVSLDLEHVELPQGKRASVWIRGKGRADRIRLTLPAPTRLALEAWIEARGGEPGALFVSLARGGRRRRLGGRGIGWIVGKIGEAAGLGRVRPHGLRHTAITSALEATGGDPRKVRMFSRHAKVETVMVYDDQRADVGGEVADLVAPA